MIGAVAVVILALYAAGALSAPPLPGDDRGWRRFVTPPVEGSTRIGQRFRMNADGLTAVEFRTAALGGVGGRIRIELQTWNGVTATPIRSVDVAAADLVRNEWYRFEFEPVTGSLGRLYQIELSSLEGTPGAGVALWATKGERFRDGTLIANGVERWADLAFRVDATVPPPPPAWTNLSHPRVQLTYGILALVWLGVAFAVRQLARYDETLSHVRHDLLG